MWGGDSLPLSDPIDYLVCAVDTELRPLSKGPVHYESIELGTLPDVNKNISPYGSPHHITSVCGARFQPKDSPLGELHMVLPLKRLPLELEISRGFLKETHLTVKLQKDFPLAVFLGGVIGARIPHPIVAVDVPRGLLKTERMFLPMPSEGLDRKVLKRIGKSRIPSEELVERLNEDEEIRTLLDGWPKTWKYALEMGRTLDSLSTKLSSPMASAVSLRSGSLIDLVFLATDREGITLLAPVEDGTAVLVASLPESVAFPLEVFPMVDGSLQALGPKPYLEEAMMGRKILVERFVPFRLSISLRLRLMERIASVLQAFDYDGPVESRPLPKGGMSSLAAWMTGGVAGRRLEVDASLRPLSQEESLEVAADTVAEFLQRIDFRGQLKRRAQERETYIQELEKSAKEWAEPSVASLVQWLRSEDSSTRIRAAKVLRKRKDPTTVEALIQALREDDHCQVRSIAAGALGKIGDPSGVAPLIQAMEDEDSNVRQNAAYALANLGDVAALEALTKATEDESWFVRGAARSSIKRIGGKQ